MTMADYGQVVWPAIGSESLFGVNILLGQHQQTRNPVQSNTYQDISQMMKKEFPYQNEAFTKISAIEKELEMEKFGDLSPYLPNVTKKAAAQMLDELNTPIFDRKGPFEFCQPYQPNDSVNTNTQTDFKIKTECDLPTSPAYCLSNILSGLAKEDPPSSTINIEDYGIVFNENAHFSPTNSENGDVYINNNTLKGTPTYNTELEEELEYLKTVRNIQEMLSNSDSGATVFEIKPSALSPESSSSECPKKNFRQLKLNVTGKYLDNSSAVSTPDVIKTITDIENENFNILDIVSDKEIGTVSTEDLHLTIPTTTYSPLVTSETTQVSPGQSNKKIPSKTRRKKSYDDSDEDYVPPVRMGRKSITMGSVSSGKFSDSSSDEESEEKCAPVRRGRPPKRMSVSSDSSKDSGAMRYRELRDKNNEASRKSRLKRKIKEMSLEKEAEELEDANVKLKAKVENLERTVNNFRKNLFSIMLTK